LARKPSELRSESSRETLEKAGAVLMSARAPRWERLEALGTLLSAYSLGSRTATRGLQEFQALFPSWRLPPRERAMVVAHEAFAEAKALKAAHRAGETLPGY
jgi:hypothetical protein